MCMHVYICVHTYCTCGVYCIDAQSYKHTHKMPTIVKPQGIIHTYSYTLTLILHKASFSIPTTCIATVTFAM